MSWTDMFSDADFWGSLFQGGAGLAGNLLTNDVNNESRQDELALAQQQLDQSREMTLAQIAASQANAGVAAETAKEIAKRQIAAQLAGNYGDLLSRSSLQRAEALKNKDVEIPQSISSMFGRVQQSLGR